MFTFTPFPELETKNLVLRKMTPGDIPDLYEMRKDPRMIAFTDSQADESQAETKEYLDKMNEGVAEGWWVIWAIEYKQTKKVIGTICIWNIDEDENSAEVGYGIIPDYQGQGLMKEALLQVTDYGFQVMSLAALEAYTEEQNKASIKLLEKSGFTAIRKVADEGYFSDRIFQMIVYRLENNHLKN